MGRMWSKNSSINARHNQYFFTQPATVDLAAALCGFMKLTNN